ncbi:cytochrome P450 [Chytriomyces sp. MP71]|nr:cytochrome P450 [Chytriomyces sp. MP71]
MTKGALEDMFLGNILLGGLPTLTHHSNPDFKAFRKIVQATLTRSALTKSAPVFEHETALFLASLASNGLGVEMDIKPHVHRYSFSMILNICFGLNLRELSDDFVQDFFDNTDLIFLLAGAATDKLAFFPWMGLFPDPNVARAKEVRKKGTAFISRLMGMTREKVAARDEGNLGKSLESKYISDDEIKTGPESVLELLLHTPSMTTGITDSSLTNMFNNLTVGAVDTVSIAIQWAFAFLAKYPDHQEALHTEMDALLARSRLPNLADEPYLPRLSAFLRESQRVRPVSATAVPRVTLSDQKWNGYTIPRGTWVMFDFHGLARDEASYGSDGEAFRPGRYLDGDGAFLKGLDTFYKGLGDEVGSHPRGFSVGRRVCPGKDLAQMQLFMAIAQAVQVFHVSAGESGVNLDDMQPGLTNPPRNLKIKLKERFPGALDLLRNVA